MLLLKKNLQNLQSSDILYYYKFTQLMKSSVCMDRLWRLVFTFMSKIQHNLTFHMLAKLQGRFMSIVNLLLRYTKKHWILLKSSLPILYWYLQYKSFGTERNLREATLVVTRLPEVWGPAIERRLFKEVEANTSKVQLVILLRQP